MESTDTAVLEPGTAVDTLDTEAFEEVTDLSPADTTVEAPDTDEAASSPDTEETPEDAEEPKLTAAEVEAKLKEERSRWESELRASAEEHAREAAANQRRSQAQAIRAGEVQKQIEGMVRWAYKQAEEGKDLPFNPQAAAAIANSITAGVFQEQADAWAASFNGFLAKEFKDFKPSREVMARVATAFRDWNPLGAVEAQFAAMQEAVRAEIEPKLRKEIEAEIKQKNEAAGKTAQIRNAAAARSSAGRPTAGGDAGGSARTPRQILDDPNSSVADRIKALKATTGYDLAL